MFAKLIVAALVATSTAFAPSRGVARSSSLKMGFERYVEDLLDQEQVGRILDGHGLSAAARHV